MKKLGLYIHIPFCRSRCAYCDFVSCTDFHLTRKYAEAVIKEIENSGRLADGYVADTVFVGGGTPTALPAGLLSEIMNAVSKNIKLDLSEFTVECNPESLEQHIGEYKALGVNRISLGLQSLNDKILKRIGRGHNSAEAVKAVELAASRFDNISCDMMLGLPGDNTADCIKGIKKLTLLPVKHISCYALKVERGTPLNKLKYKPDEDRQAEMYGQAAEILREAGLERYEVSNFARKGCECKHNLKYWNRQDYLGIGLGAHSLIGDVRFNNCIDMKKYLNGDRPKKTKVLKADALSERIMLGLRLEKGINIHGINREFGIDFKTKYAKAVEKSGNYIDINGDIRIKPEYTYVGNKIIVNFI